MESFRPPAPAFVRFLEAGSTQTPWSGRSSTFEEPGSGQTITRRPRRVVPLRKDELLGILVEVERVQLADDALLLVKDDKTLVADVLEVVAKYGHHGTVYRSTTETGDPVLTRAA